MKEVVAALIRRGDHFLICRRPENKARPLLWEYPGGKVEEGETRAEALRRECREELDISLRVGRPVMDVNHVYPDLTIHLTLLEGEIEAGEPRMLEHCDLKWITAEELDGFPFCPADEEINAYLKTYMKEERNESL